MVWVSFLNQSQSTEKQNIISGLLSTTDLKDLQKPGCLLDQVVTLTVKTNVKAKEVNHKWLSFSWISAVYRGIKLNAVLGVITNGSNMYIASTHTKSLVALGETRPSPPVLLFSLHQAQQCCQLRHVISLWRLLTLERARLLMKRGEVRNTTFSSLTVDIKIILTGST